MSLPSPHTQKTFSDVWRYCWLSQLGGGRKVLLASGGWRPQVLLRQPPLRENYPAQHVSSARLKKLCIMPQEGKKSFRSRYYFCFSGASSHGPHSWSWQHACPNMKDISLGSPCVWFMPFGEREGWNGCYRGNFLKIRHRMTVWNWKRDRGMSDPSRRRQYTEPLTAAPDWAPGAGRARGWELRPHYPQSERFLNNNTVISEAI